MNIAELAEKYGLPEDALASTLMLAKGVFQLDKPPSIKERLRELKRERKKAPDDMDLWEEEFRLNAGQEKVIINSETREIAVEKNDAHKRNSNRTDRRLDIAVMSLHDLWCQYRGGKLSRYEGGEALSFLEDALRSLKVHDTHLSHSALRFRLRKLYKS